MSSRFPPFLILCFALVAVVIRLTPHAPNMTPMGALALTAGIFLAGRYTWVLPIVVLFATDLVLGGYAWPVMLAVYGSFALVTLIGRALQRASRIEQVLIGSCAASLLFFMLTNFAVWAWTPLYAKTWDGLLLAYTLAAPFYRNMLVGDMFYTTAFFIVIALTNLSINFGTTKIRMTNS